MIFNKKPKVILKSKNYDDNGLLYSSNYQGDEGVCFSMALSFAVCLAKENGISLIKFKNLATKMWKELEENENGKN